MNFILQNSQRSRGLDGSGMVVTRNRMFAQTIAPLFARITAWVLAGGVLALTLLAVSPDWHEVLHAHDGAGAHAGHGDEHEAPVESADHVCAVTLFAAGVLGLLIFCLVLLGRSLLRSEDWLATVRLAAAYPHYWLVPAHAPPAV